MNEPKNARASSLQLAFRAGLVSGAHSPRQQQKEQQDSPADVEGASASQSGLRIPRPCMYFTGSELVLACSGQIA